MKVEILVQQTSTYRVIKEINENEYDDYYPDIEEVWDEEVRLKPIDVSPPFIYDIRECDEPNELKNQPPLGGANALDTTETS